LTGFAGSTRTSTDPDRESAYQSTSSKHIAALGGRLSRTEWPDCDVGSHGALGPASRSADWLDAKLLQVSQQAIKGPSRYNKVESDFGIGLVPFLAPVRWWVGSCGRNDDGCDQQLGEDRMPRTHLRPPDLTSLAASDAAD